MHLSDALTQSSLQAESLLSYLIMKNKKPLPFFQAYHKMFKLPTFLYHILIRNGCKYMKKVQASNLNGHASLEKKIGLKDVF